jgi:hypothetical protein
LVLVAFRLLFASGTDVERGTPTVAGGRAVASRRA